MEDFLADPGPPVRGRRPLAPCAVDGCRYGRSARNGLCSKHRDRWNRAGQPDLATWDAPDLATSGTMPAECRLPFCSLWVANPTKIFCTGHDDRWQRHGRPGPDRFIAGCELVGTACIDLHDLAPPLRLEIQYALQCRHDARSRAAAPRLVTAVRHVKAMGVTSLLDLSEQQWRQSASSRVGESALFLLDARDALESLRDGTGWEIEYPRDVWRLHKLPGITIPAGRPCPRARLRFDRITQPWLRELAKRWTRLRLTSGLSIGAARGGVDALTCFSKFLTLTGVDTLADVDRPLLERYLAHVTSQPGGHGMKKTRIGGLNLFFQNIRQNGWDDTLPGTAAFYLGDIPSVPEQVDRRLAEYVMTQIEAPANLDRWPSPAGRLITLVLTRCGLRISSALALDFDCLLHDGQGAPYLRYFNTKMRREAAVPIDEELEASIRDQQRRVLNQWPEGTACFPGRPATAPSPLCGAWTPPASASPSIPSPGKPRSPDPGSIHRKTCAPRSSNSASGTRPLHRRRFLPSGSAHRIPRCYAGWRRRPSASAAWRPTTRSFATHSPEHSANAGPPRCSARWTAATRRREARPNSSDPAEQPAHPIRQ